MPRQQLRGHYRLVHIAYNLFTNLVHIEHEIVLVNTDV